MAINKIFAATIFTVLLSSSAIWADSEKIINPSNNHTYKRFDSTQRTWQGAKAACTAEGAHLVTITSLQEQNWVSGNFSGDNVGEMWLGGTNESQNGIWTWVTGEPWAYVNWYSNTEPTSPHYLITRSYPYNPTWTSSGSPNNPSKTAAYICEWEAVQYLSMTPIPNAINNKPANYALLALNGGSYALYLVNGVTGKRTASKSIGNMASVTFKTLSVTEDANGDNLKDIAVLLSKNNATSVLMIYNGVNLKPLKTINLPIK